MRSRDRADDRRVRRAGATAGAAVLAAGVLAGGVWLAQGMADGASHVEMAGPSEAPEEIRPALSEVARTTDPREVYWEEAQQAHLRLGHELMVDEAKQRMKQRQEEAGDDE